MPSAQRWNWRAIGSSIRGRIALGLLIVVLLAAIFGRSAIDLAVGTIYKNAAEPLDKELPVTVTSFSAGVSHVSAIGGMGEGLNCSLPWGFDYVFTGRPPTVPVRQRFRQACVFHDLCYRHGLATYGYTQSDCDELLQEQALRICVSVSQKNLSECQIDAKKIAAGVKLGGFKSFQPWGTSTYFEFDPNPYRSIRFFSVRSINHPFKALSPATYGSEPNQLLMSFRIMRGGIRYACLNCKERDVSREEFAAAGAPFDTVKLNAERTLWIPSGRLYAAPHVSPEHGAVSPLVWFARETIDNSRLCTVVADPRKLLTDNMPKASGCYKNANLKLGLAGVDLNSSSPQLSLVSRQPAPGELSQPSLVGSGLTGQKSGELQVCVSGDLRYGRNPRQPSNVAEAVCHKLKSETGTISGTVRWGAFQNFPVVRGERHIFLQRAMPDLRNPGSLDTVRALVFDIKGQHLPSSTPGPPGIDLTMDKRFEVDDSFDPVFPLAMQASDMRLIGMKVARSWLAYKLRLSTGTVGLYEVDIASAKPEMLKIPLETGGARALEFHETWARRPMLVLEDEAAAPKTTQLVLSRSKTSTVEAELPKGEMKGRDLDEVRFEFAVLERPIAAPAQTPFKLVRGLVCTVIYTIVKLDEDRIDPCRRTERTVSSHRATPATRLQGAQMLVGQFTESAEQTIALFERCILSGPLIVRPVAIGASASPLQKGTAASANGHLQRQFECSPVARADVVAEPMR